MFWRFGEISSDPSTVLIFDEVRHRLRCGQRPWIRMPHYPALILSLLVRMQANGRSASTDQIRAFLDLPHGARVRGYVTELRKKLAETGADPSRLLEPIHGQSGYRLCSGVEADKVLEAEALRMLDEILASPEPVPSRIRTQLQELRSMLLVTTLVALGLPAYFLFRPDPDEGEAIAFVPEEGGERRITKRHTLIPTPSVRTSSCFELPHDVRLSNHADLLIELSLPTSPNPVNVELTFERLHPGTGRTLIGRALQSGAQPTTLRVPARELDQEVRDHLRRVCIAPVAGFELRRLQIEVPERP